MCNAGGPRSKGFAGGSGVWAPFKGNIRGRQIASDVQDERGDEYEPIIEFFDVELDRLLKVARDTYQIRQDWEKQAGRS
jgi:hypothetical protein